MDRSMTGRRLCIKFVLRDSVSAGCGYFFGQDLGALCLWVLPWLAGSNNVGTERSW